MAAKFLQRYSQIIGGVTSALASVAVMLPHTLGLPNYQEVMQFHEHGFPKKMDPDLKKMADEVLKSLNWSSAFEDQVSFFLTSSQDIVHKGSIATRTGAIIGIPVNFMCKTRDDMGILQQAKMQLYNKQIDWYSDDGEKFQNSLILSDTAQKFAVARELFYTKTQYVYVHTIMTGLMVYSAYSLSYFANRMLPLLRRLKFPLRLSVYGSITGFCSVFYFLLKDAYNCHLDKHSDKKAAGLGKEYAKGGVEFYEKMISKNLAICALNEEHGPKYYTAYGNNRTFWRTPHLLLTQRRDLLLKLLKDGESNEESAVNYDTHT